MKVDIVSIFPRMVEAGLREGVVGRAIEAGIIDVRVHDLRSFTTDRHHVVDDSPFGGGPGMVLKPEPLFAAVEAIAAGRQATVVLTSPDGKGLTPDIARRLSAQEHVIILCGRYEGVDERVREHLATEVISIGDYVLSGGELAALVIVDAAARFVPGVVGDDESVANDTFSQGLLDYPQYTRPAEFRGYQVPQVLLSGHHAEIERWRRQQALERTRRHRPDLLERTAKEGEKS
ncbi:MAG TPA: tRNA (guanosine(37)-N1)-methyltransferase TrmD [Vicinamibacterales bacterium]|nr:tRNA (guanosine(37)-N1)-methyltransferase TrmD [Vicinamibacterales bacterium]